MKFSAAMTLFYVLSLVPIFQHTLSLAAIADAQVSSAILNSLGEKSHVTGATIWAGENAIITVLPACTAIELLWFFFAVIMSFPSSFARKVPGVLAGVALLVILNLGRVTSLYFIGVHFPGLFDTAHEELWGVVLTLATIALCVLWIGWARRDDRFEFHAGK